MALREYLYYEEPGITLYCGDCREVLPRLVKTPDMLLTDPPYPGFDKGWTVPDVPDLLAQIQARVVCVFWPALLAAPVPAVAEHIWHKPNARSSQHYERIIMAGDVPRVSRVYRVAAILPDYVQYAQEALAHPTQKPIKLVAHLIRQYARGLVLDPFSGSGTTLEAAKREQRPAIGIECNPSYCEMTVTRLRQGVLALDVA